MRALYPPIRPGDKDWRDYYLLRNLNPPDHYHNGGAWPYIGGFYVAALVQAGRLDEAAHQLGKLRAMNRVGSRASGGSMSVFTGSQAARWASMGSRGSAALNLYARDAVRRGRPALIGWGGARG